MTNVINPSNSTAMTSSVHGSSISQADDLLPALSSLTFNVSNSGIDTGDSGSSGITSTPSGSGSNSSNSVTVNRGINQSNIDDPIDTQLNLLNPILNNNSIDAKDKKADVSDLHLQHQQQQQQSLKSSELLTILTVSNNGASTSPAMSASQMSLSSYDYTTNTNDSPVWSNVDDGGNHNISSNGFKGSPTGRGFGQKHVGTCAFGRNSAKNTCPDVYLAESSAGGGYGAATYANMHQHQQQQQQQNRRAITASHGCYQSGLPQNPR